MNENMRSKEQGLSKRLKPFDLFTVGFGAIIGVGWVLVIGNWVNMGGGPLVTVMSFLFGALCLYPIARIFGALSVAMPVAGGAFVYTLRAFGRKSAFVTGWLLTLAYVMMCPWEVIAIGQLAESLFPALATVPLYTIGEDTIYLPTLCLCLCVALSVVFINYLGIDKVTKLQKFLVIVLLAISAMILVVASVLGSVGNLTPLFTQTPENPTGNMLVGFIAVLSMAPFFYAGFDTIVQGVEEVSSSANKRFVGSLSAKAVCIAGVFYALIISAVCMTMPWQEMLPLTLPAAEVFSIGLGLDFMKVIVIVGAFCGIVTTLNSFYIAGARLMLSMGRSGLIPSAFSRVHSRYHTPTISNIFIGILTIAGSFLSKGLLLPIVNVCSFGYIFAWFAVSLSGLRIRKMLSVEFPYPISKSLNIVAIFLSFSMMLLLVVPGSPGALTWPLEISIVIVWLILGILAYMMMNHNRDRLKEVQPQEHSNTFR